MVKRVLGEGSEHKIQQISLSDDTVKLRISEMSDDIMEQLETTTIALYVMEKLTSFFTSNWITWKNCCGGCTDGAPAMLGSKSGLQKHVKEVALNAKGVHCMIHSFALASKTLPDALCKILEAVVKCVNFVKAGDLNSLLFQNLCRGLDSEHETLLFCSKARWLSTGNVVNRVFELREELKLFLEMNRKDDLLSHFNEVLWEPRLAYLADIFEQLNRLNLKLQGKERNVFHHMDCIRAFLHKLQNWQRKEEEKLVNPFSGTLDIAAIPDDGHDEFLDLRNESAARDLCEEKSLTRVLVIDHLLVNVDRHVAAALIVATTESDTSCKSFGMSQFFRSADDNTKQKSQCSLLVTTSVVHDTALC
ncbi:protein FAM200B-like [Homarus americanus]|uniref:protein FAM200B-like n=1 Tax=Homarus americanus TaxID=6706 RepID=UPI001C464BEF|nr:protein FAM200B-like [Homarus americanus]